MYLCSLVFNHTLSDQFFDNNFIFDDETILGIQKSLLTYSSILGCCILQTCNRFEVYVSCNDKSTSIDHVFRELSKASNISVENIISKFKSYTCFDTIHHLFTVASGIDSLLIGEDQILGQIRSSYQRSKECGSVDKVLHSLFQKALHVGKRVRTESMISRNALSYAGLTSDIIKNSFHSDKSINIMILGYGDIGATIAKNLAKNQKYTLFIPYRSPEKKKAIQLLESSIRVLPFNEYKEYINKVDVVVGCAKSSHFLVTEKDFDLKYSKLRVIIDLSVPKSIDPLLKCNSQVKYFDMEDFKTIVQDHKKDRMKEIDKAKRIVREEERSFEVWIQSIHTDPIIEQLKASIDSIKEEELLFLKRKLGNQSGIQTKAIEEFAHKLSYKILHYPIHELKNSVQKEYHYDLLFSVIKLFHLESASTKTILKNLDNSDEEKNATP